MKTKRIMFAFIAMLGLFLAAWNSRAADSAVTAAMIGPWNGNAHIIVSWCRQTNLPVVLTISSEGTVTGKVGDATLTKGQFTRNRGWLGRKLNLATDYIVRGDLTGPIVAADGVRRERVSIPLNFTGGIFTGGVHTSGSKFGGKEKMILSAKSLRLTRAPVGQRFQPVF